MVNKCVAFGCKTSYDSQKNDAVISVFHFPSESKRPQLRNAWIGFVNRSNWEPNGSSVLCEKHFSKELISRGKSKCTLKFKLNPVPTIHSNDSLKRPSALPTPEPPPRKLPKLRGIQEDELNILFKNCKHLDLY